MIKEILHKSLSFVMALVVLFSTLSFTVERHYCGDFLVDTAVFTKAKSCNKDVSHTDEETVVVMKPCCKNEVDVVKGQDQLKNNSFDDLDFKTQSFITTLVLSYFDLFESLPKLKIPHKNYDPPSLIVDYQVLHDVYII
ncbi:hypothetical protein [uncultured Olleya sp.]|uniref:HYC_CC_PP family protein n=1 Tax=uncultured Olleya sp. TaxID=757243 RepID=UPI0025973B4D|nr:hypothetical protein [uncultured Olleya sp.]